MPPLETEQAKLEAYVARLRKRLSALPAGDREDVVRELAAHLQEGVARGEDPEVLFARMGEPEALAAAMLQERMVTVDRRRSPVELLRIMAAAALKPFAITMAVWFVVMVLNTWYLYASLIRHGHQLLPLLLSNIPSILVVCLPIATVTMGLFGVPRLARELSPALFRQVLPRMVLALLVGSVLAGGLGFVFNDTLVIAANRATVDYVRSELIHQPAYSDAERSIQEHSLLQASAIVARKRAERDRLVAANAPYRQIHDAERQLREDAMARDFKLSIPMLTVSTGALGLAIGLAFAGRQLGRAVGILVTFATILGGYQVMNWARLSEMPAAYAAWAANLGLLAIAGLIRLADASWKARRPHAEEA